MCPKDLLPIQYGISDGQYLQISEARAFVVLVEGTTVDVDVRASVVLVEGNAVDVDVMASVVLLEGTTVDVDVRASVVLVEGTTVDVVVGESVGVVESCDVLQEIKLILVKDICFLINISLLFFPSTFIYLNKI